MKFTLDAAGKATGSRLAVTVLAPSEMVQALGVRASAMLAKGGRSGKIEPEDLYRQEWRTYVQARALENAFFTVASNRIGEEYSYHFFGESMVVGPRGEVYASIDEEIEGYALTTVDLEAVRKAREELQLIQCRVPTAYRSVVRKY